MLFFLLPLLNFVIWGIPRYSALIIVVLWDCFVLQYRFYDFLHLRETIYFQNYAHCSSIKCTAYKVKNSFRFYYPFPLAKYFIKHFLNVFHAPDRCCTTFTEQKGLTYYCLSTLTHLTLMHIHIQYTLYLNWLAIFKTSSLLTLKANQLL